MKRLDYSILERDLIAKVLKQNPEWASFRSFHRDPSGCYMIVCYHSNPRKPSRKVWFGDDMKSTFTVIPWSEFSTWLDLYIEAYTDTEISTSERVNSEELTDTEDGNVHYIRAPSSCSCGECSNPQPTGSYKATSEVVNIDGEDYTVFTGLV